MLISVTALYLIHGLTNVCMTASQKLLQRFFWDRQVQFAKEAEQILRSPAMQPSFTDKDRDMMYSLLKTIDTFHPSNTAFIHIISQIMDRVKFSIEQVIDMPQGLTAYLDSMKFTKKLFDATRRRFPDDSMYDEQLIDLAEEKPHLFWYCIFDPLMKSNRVLYDAIKPDYNGLDPDRDHLNYDNLLLDKLDPLNHFSTDDIREVSETLRTIADSNRGVCHEYLSNIIKDWYEDGEDTPYFTFVYDRKEFTQCLLVLLEEIGVRVIFPSQSEQWSTPIQSPSYTQEPYKIIGHLTEAGETEYVILLTLETPAGETDTSNMDMRTCMSMLHERIQALEVHL